MVTATATATEIATSNEDAKITFESYASANGKDYYEIISNGIPTQKFVEVPTRSAPTEILKAYEAGNIVG